MQEKVYSSSLGNDVLKEFIQPELTGATKYLRSTGHFSSSFLISAADIFADYFNSNNEMKVICCIELSQEDYHAIEQGSKEEDILKKSIFKELSTFNEKIQYLKTHSLEAFQKLITNNNIEIKVVVPPYGGIYHQKFGLIYRPDRNSCFMGGFNLSMSGHILNSEICETSLDENKFKTYELIFNTIWNNNSQTDKCYAFPEACKKIIIKDVDDELLRRNKIKIEKPIEKTLYDDLWQHQKDAFNSFFKHDCKGIIQMATGTGKTKLALAIYQKISADKKINLCLLVAGRNTLLDQWAIEISNVFPDYGLVRRYDKYNDLCFLNSFISTNTPVFILTTYELLPETEKLINIKKDSCFIMCDEVHNFGAQSCTKNLNGTLYQYSYKIGLSATPERMYDEEGTDFIKTEIGNIIFKYPLKKAIDDDILCKFDYAPISYELSKEELERISKLVRRLYAQDTKNSSTTEIMRQISDVYKESKMKLIPFKKFISSKMNLLKRCVIFVSDKNYGAEVQKIIYDLDPHFKYHTFYDTDDDKYLKDFSNRKLDCLITCNKISEGISINDINNIILFSASRSDTETLQRIGRCLRKDKKNPSKKATIVDFVIQRKIDEKKGADYDRYSQLCELCDRVIK